MSSLIVLAALILLSVFMFSITFPKKTEIVVSPIITGPGFSAELIMAPEYSDPGDGSSLGSAPYVVITNISSEVIKVSYGAGSLSERTLWAEKIYDTTNPNVTQELPSWPIDPNQMETREQTIEPGATHTLRGNPQYFLSAINFAQAGGKEYRDITMDIRAQFEIIFAGEKRAYSEILTVPVRIYPFPEYIQQGVN